MSKVEVCWALTTKCNENCKYCYRFLDLQDVKYEENEKILRKLISDGVREITWTGGEALLYKGFTDLLKIAKQNGVKSKLITNGTIVANNNDIREICNYLDSLTLSLDSVDDEINIELGRGKQHYSNIKTVLEYLKDKELKVTINTVVSKINIGHLEELGRFISNYNVSAWRIFKFTSLRETAIENKDIFDITTDEFNSKKKVLNKFTNIPKIEYRQGNDFENKYLNIINAGDVTKTENGVDVIVGNILKDNFADILKNSEKSGIFVNALKLLKENGTMKKIRTLISYDDLNIAETIENYIKDLDFVEVVAKTINGQETYRKIVELKPEMVFAKYDMPDMSSIEIMKKSKQELADNVPVFNFFAKEMPMSEIEKAYDIIGSKLNSLRDEANGENVKEILEQYKEYKEMNNLN